MAGTKFTGIDAMKRRVRAMHPELLQHVEPALREGANEIAGMARRLVPVRSGRLKDSIQATPGAQDLVWLVTAGSKEAFYAPFVERGSKGQPFLNPSYQALKRRVKSRVSRAMKRAIKEATQRS